MCTKSRTFQDDVSSAPLNTFNPGPTWFLSENELLIREVALVHSVSILYLFLAFDDHKESKLQDWRFKTVHLRVQRKIQKSNYQDCNYKRIWQNMAKKCLLNIVNLYCFYIFDPQIISDGNFNMIYFYFQEVRWIMIVIEKAYWRQRA